MSEETQVEETTVTEPVVEDDKPKTVPYVRFSEVIAKGKTETERANVAEEKLAALEADKEKVRKAKLEKDGEHKTLLAEANTTIETLTSERNTAVEWRKDYETNRREALTSDLSEVDKAMAMKIPDLTDMEAFVDRISESKLPGTDTRPANSGLSGGLKPIAEMSDKERRETHAARLAQYR